MRQSWMMTQHNLKHFNDTNHFVEEKWREQEKDTEREERRKKIVTSVRGAIDVKLLNSVTHEYLAICMTH